MSVTKTARTVILTAVNEFYAFDHTVKLVGLSFQAAGATAGHRLVVRDTRVPGAGDILADYLVEGTQDNADLWAGAEARNIDAIGIDNLTVGGTWAVTARIVD